MEIKNYLKSILKLNAMNYKELAERLTEVSGKKYTQGSLTGKINRDGITLKEAALIAEILGYSLEFVKH